MTIFGNVRIKTAFEHVIYRISVGKSESERILVDILLNLQQDIARSTVMMSKNPRYVSSVLCSVV